MNLLPTNLQPNSNVRSSNIEDGLSSRTLQLALSPPEHNIQLARFRHMVGIYSSKDLSTTYGYHKDSRSPDLSHDNLHSDGRSAPNLGIYNRVCHREAKAKRGFKFASLLINSCLGIQVVVAAALTAMGAADTNRSAITLFGAINTCIAGILTYLKGSGLPNRIRWYENEWKKVREYIEQRERDFARADCRLDVNQVVQVVEAMYEEVKADIQNNTPAMYISVNEIRARSATVQQTPHVPTLDTLMREADKQVQSGFQEAGDKDEGKMTEISEGLANKTEQRLEKLKMEVEETKPSARQGSPEINEKGAELYEKELESAKNEGSNKTGTPTKDIDSTRAGDLQSEANPEKSPDDLGEKIQTGHELGKELERAHTSLQITTEDVQSTGGSAPRTAKKVDDGPGTHN